MNNELIVTTTKSKSGDYTKCLYQGKVLWLTDAQIPLFCANPSVRTDAKGTAGFYGAPDVVAQTLAVTGNVVVTKEQAWA